jgi:HD-GYP domain-containing protein (c-di-GMP phosphodiesterase class II)/DNA-binding LacI/PurR family transcriptional regulator
MVQNIDRILEPSHHARPTIGMLVDWIEDPYQFNILQGVMGYIEECDINFVCFEGGAIQTPIDYEARRNVVFELPNPDNVDGLVILSPTIGHFVDYESITAFCKKFSPLPIVSIALEIANIHSVITDNFGGMRDLVTHLIETHRFRRFSFIKGPESNQDATERYKAFQETLLHYNIQPDPTLIVQGTFVTDSGKAAIKQLLDERHAAFDVVVACNDDMALGAIHELNSRGFKVPEDIAVTGFDNLDFSVHSSPPITTVNHSLYAQGWQAAETLVNLIANKVVSRQIIVPAKLVVRKSCGCFSHASLPVGVEPVKDLTLTFPENFMRDKNQICQTVFEKTHFYFNIKKEMDFRQTLEGFCGLFTDGFDRQTKVRFLQELQKTLEHPDWSSKDILTWQLVIAEIRQSLLPYLTSPDLLSGIEELWHEAQTIIGEKALIQEKLGYHQSLKANRTLQELRQKLLVTLDQDQLLNLLSQTMPVLGIQSGYIMMFDNPEHQKLKLILAYNENGRIDFDEEAVFPVGALTLREFLAGSGRYHLLIEALSFSIPLSGLVIYEMSSMNWKNCGELRRVICSTLQSAALFKQIQDQASSLRTQKANISQNLAKLRVVMSGFIKAMDQTVETRDPYTAGHQQRVADLATAIATEMKLPQDMIEGIRVAGIVHDLGKINIPAEILNKPGRLKEIEFNLIKCHPVVAFDILKNIDFPWPIARIVLQHHERLDGSGYPEGLREPDIMTEAKILCVADVVEAMASHRPYRPSLGVGVALEEITKNRGCLYDTRVVDACLQLFHSKGYDFNIAGQ